MSAFEAGKDYSAVADELFKSIYGERQPSKALLSAALGALAELQCRRDEVERLRGDVQQAFAIAGWYEVRLAIVRRDGWEALKVFDAQNPAPDALPVASDGSKMQVTFDVAALAKLRGVAEKAGVTPGEALARALGTFDWLLDRVDEGYEVGAAKGGEDFRAIGLRGEWT